MLRDRRRRRNRSDGYVLAALIALGLLVTRAQDVARSRNGVDPLTGLAGIALAPASITAGRAIDGIEGNVEGWTRGARIAEENRVLRARLASIDLYEERIRLLQRELDALRPVSRRAIRAEIVGYAASEGRLSLDKGGSAGVRPGLGAVNANGLLGIVQTVSTDRSVALTLGSPSCRFGILDLGTVPPLVGLARGTGADEVEVTFYAPNAPVAVGHLIVTSGFAEALPRGLVVGRIREVIPRPDFGQVRAIVTPAADVGATRTVEIVR